MIMIDLISSSFDQRVPEMIAASNIKHLRIKVLVLAYKQTIVFVDEIAVINQFFVQVVDLSVLSHDPHTGLRRKYLLGFRVQGEWSWLIFDEHPRVEDFVSLSSKDKRVGGGFEVHYLFALEELIVNLIEGEADIIADDERIHPGTKNAAVVDTSTVDSPVVEQQDDVLSNGEEFCDFGVSLMDKLLHLG